MVECLRRRLKDVILLHTAQGMISDLTREDEQKRGRNYTEKYII